MKRALIILALAMFGVHSPSLGRRVRISDIWRTPQYAGASIRRTNHGREV